VHVAFVHPDPNRETAVAERLRRVAGSLARHGHEATWFRVRPRDDGGSSATVEHEGVTYRSVSDSRGWFAATLPAALSRADPDVVHAAGSEPGSALAARLSGVPLVLEWYGETDSRWLDRAFGAADAVVVPSEHVRTTVRERGVDADATVIPGNVDPRAVRATDPVGAADVAWSGRLDDDANLGSLLLALAELRDRALTAAVIGDGPERARYERQARDLGLAGRVSFLGDLPRAERIARLKGAHAFVHTADRCPFAAELLAALACGCVGIVEYRRDSAAHELVAGYDRGFGVTNGEELVGAIADAEGFPREEYDPRFERFSRASVFDRYLATYREVCAKRGTNRGGSSPNLDRTAEDDRDTSPGDGDADRARGS
jgi:glycosyltransferase involved in cell wall biosynthesis